MTSDLVSVIMPCYNDQKFIAASVKSVLSQSYKNIELIVCDDASTDDTVEIVDALNDGRIVLNKMFKNSGPAAARNAALRLARGRYIAFLDSDDTWTQDKIQTQIIYMSQNTVEICSCNFNIMTEDGKISGQNAPLPRLVGRKKLLRYCSIQTSGLIYDTQIIEKKYFPNLAKRQDYGMFLQLLGSDRKAHILPERLMNYRVRKNSVSSQKLKNINFQWRIYRDVEGFSGPQSAYYLTNWFIRSGSVGAFRKLSRLWTYASTKG